MAEIKQTVVGTIQKNNRGDYFKITTCENEQKNTKAVDIREFYTDDNDNILPTKKGVRVNDEKVAELVKYIFEASSIEAKQEILDFMGEKMNEEE